MKCHCSRRDKKSFFQQNVICNINMKNQCYVPYWALNYSKLTIQVTPWNEVSWFSWQPFSHAVCALDKEQDIKLLPWILFLYWYMKNSKRSKSWNYGLIYKIWNEKHSTFWWLIRVNLVVAFGFYPKILGGWGDLGMQVLWWGYHEVVGILKPT